MDNVVDAIAVGRGPADISQEIKDALYSKASERIDTYRSVVADRLMGGTEVTDEPEVEVEGEEEWLRLYIPRLIAHPLVIAQSTSIILLV